MPLESVRTQLPVSALLTLPQLVKTLLILATTRDVRKCLFELFQKRLLHWSGCMRFTLAGKRFALRSRRDAEFSHWSLVSSTECVAQPPSACGQTILPW